MNRDEIPRPATDPPETSVMAQPPASELDRVLAKVRRTFGFENLRPLQEQAIVASLARRDALVVLPTGGGKSLCYQAPALIREGLTVVVSPLISLMKDQVDGLQANGVAAELLCSAQDAGEKHAVQAAIDSGELRLLFVSPERLATPGFLERLEAAGIESLAVDEAHCISHWGHDFRPEYRQIGELRRKRPDLPIQAYTATATPEVREDIVAQLGLRDPEILVGSFDRPNLTYRVQPRQNLVDQIMSVLKRHSGEAGIVYCLSRKDVERTARELAGKGISCDFYHAGMNPADRQRTQERFQREELDVVVATVAFGMGIDRTDVRFVIHGSLPKGVEQYSQETGRAGRDGLPAECVMFYSGSDFHNWKNLMERSAREAAENGMSGADDELGANLERLGHLWGMATGAICRHSFLVEYFGQTFEAQEGGCGACDVCLGELARVEDSLVIAQKILSCVVRCDQRYGAGHITDVLRGADTARIRDCRHDALSTYGILAGHPVRELRHWIEQLLATGYLASTGGNYPTLHLSKTGAQCLRGETEPVLFALQEAPRSSKRKKSAESALEAAALETGGEVDEALFKRLKDLRRSLAHERGVPPYLIFNDRTLALFAAQRPTDDAELRGIKGVGDKKAADLGPVFLESIAEHAAASA